MIAVANTGRFKVQRRHPGVASTGSLEGADGTRAERFKVLHKSWTRSPRGRGTAWTRTCDMNSHDAEDAHGEHV